jgi:hypothetical protein
MEEAGTFGVGAAEVLSLMGKGRIDRKVGAKGRMITVVAGRTIELLGRQNASPASGTSANAAFGKGGRLTITIRAFLDNTSATRSFNGVVIIPALDLNGSLLRLPAKLVGDQGRSRERYGRPGDDEISAFIVRGRRHGSCAGREST